MRYMNWDVLIFPEVGDNKTPLQEFGTNCTVTQDPDTAAMPMPSHPNFTAVTHPLPTVSSYIPSLLNGTPFRVSLHSWAAPVPSRATKAMAHDESMVYYEAKVLLDGICTAGILFNQDPSWPQVIEGDKGSHHQLRFPPFHKELLTQVWADAAQNMGRIKIIVAEGIHDGQPAAGFQRLRNMVTFSFQHAPLHILENCGIAWPNPGMWWQGQPQFNGSSSPRKELADREAHTHSPRRREASMKMAGAQLESSMAPPPMPSDLRIQEAFRIRGLHKNDPFWSQHSQMHDPFVGSAEYNNFYNKMTSRSSSGSGDVSMPDTSRYGSSIHDVPMHDYQRSLSPASNYRSYPMPDTSRLQSQAASRNVSGYPNTGVREPRLGVMLQGPEDNSQFNDMIASLSPRITSGISAPSNTRVSSAANTPPGPHRDGSAAVNRAASYTGHARSVPVTANDPPPPYIRVPSNLAKPQSESRKSSSSASVIHEDTGDQVEPPIAKKPRGRPKGRKEGRTSEIGLEVSSEKTQRRTSASSITASGKENSQEANENTSGEKRKRWTSEVFPKGTELLELPDSESPSPRKASKPSHSQNLSPMKLEFEDDLTPEGVVTRVRVPLGERENAV